MHITLNGEAYELEGSCNVAELLAKLDADPRIVAVERNAAIVPRSQHGATALQEGDRLEIIGFIGGG